MHSLLFWLQHIRLTPSDRSDTFLMTNYLSLVSMQIVYTTQRYYGINDTDTDTDTHRHIHTHTYTHTHTHQTILDKKNFSSTFTTTVRKEKNQTPQVSSPPTSSPFSPPPPSPLRRYDNRTHLKERERENSAIPNRGKRKGWEEKSKLIRRGWKGKRRW